MYGSTFVSGWCGYFLAGKTAPAGRILVFDDDRLYGFGRKPQYYRWTTPIEHHLFCADKLPPVAGESADAGPKRAPGFLVNHHWTKELPLFARAMVLADGTLFLAGPADAVDEEEAFKAFDDAEVRRGLLDQAIALEGKKGAVLWAVSTADGEKLAEHPLDAPPVFDGMAAAAGRLYLSAQNGEVVCFEGR
jgi:hypothetical protein